MAGDDEVETESSHVQGTPAATLQFPAPLGNQCLESRVEDSVAVSELCSHDTSLLDHGVVANTQASPSPSRSRFSESTQPAAHVALSPIDDVPSRQIICDADVMAQFDTSATGECLQLDTPTQALHGQSQPTDIISLPSLPAVNQDTSNASDQDFIAASLLLQAPATQASPDD